MLRVFPAVRSIRILRIAFLLIAGGTLPLAATLATERVFEAFRSPSKVDALLHGHSYSGYPIGCAAAVKALELMSSPQNPALCTPERYAHFVSHGCIIA